MAGYFYPDTDHNSPVSANAFRLKLEELGAQGVKTVFMEFLPVKVPGADLSVEHYVANAGGRQHMAATYLGVVHRARELGMKVVGLGHPRYLEMSRGPAAKNLCFRAMGPFDSTVACLIKFFAGATSYVVFLGSAHWPILSHYIKGLQAVVPVQERLLALNEIPDCDKNLLEAQTIADNMTRKDAGALVLAAGCENQAELDHVVKRCRGTENVEQLLAMANQVLKKLPDILQFNYLLAKWRLTEFPKQQPELAALPQIAAPLELGGRKLVLRLRGG